MTSCFAYIRVSTVKQGERGVSLQEQRSAIEQYAARHNLEVLQWFEERETAAKRGRPAFTKMLKLLRQRRAQGVLIHKIDRSARNLRDWADLGELIDSGITVHFANESLDLQTRGGRLSADIQAVVAADYIRNLREETKKGFYGRLKQGLLPLPARLGYLNCGKGKVKEIDPERGPLIRRAFELYDSGNFCLETLCDELYQLGLRNRRGKKVTRNGISTVLNDPFYMGVIRIKRTNEVFDGKHEPLISRSLFERVRLRLQGRTKVRVRRHDFLFRRLMTCGTCGRNLIGELQKGHVYYRCQTKGCVAACVREEKIDEVLRSLFERLVFTDSERAALEAIVSETARDIGTQRESSRQALTLRQKQISDRLMRLTDAYLDGEIEKSLFDERKRQLLFEQKEIEEKIRNLSDTESDDVTTRLRNLLELADTALLSYSLAPTAEKRNLVEVLTSNRELQGKNVVVRLSIPFSWIADRYFVPNGVLERATSRSNLIVSPAARTGAIQHHTHLIALVDRLMTWVVQRGNSAEEDRTFSPFL